jgi:hypothetical protein
VKNFLSVVKEGYCVQFASTLALTLREFGIPTRYVEGYVANEYNKNPYFGSSADTEIETLDSPMRYYTDVLDSDEHAWVEVWFDGIGWVQYEATPPMMSSYYPGINTEDPDDPYNPPESDTTTPEETTEPFGPGDSESLPEETTDPGDVTTEGPGETEAPVMQIIAINVGKIMLIILPIAAVILLVWFEIRRIKSGDKMRSKLVNDAKSATDDAEIKRFSSLLSDRIFEALSLFEMSPYENELPDEFKLRTARELIRIHDLMKPKVEAVEDYDASNDVDEKESTDEAVENIVPDEEIMLSDEYLLISNAIQSLEAEEFGHGMNKHEIAHAADLYAELLTIRRKKLGFGKSVIYRIILNRI